MWHTGYALDRRDDLSCYPHVTEFSCGLCCAGMRKQLSAAWERHQTETVSKSTTGHKSHRLFNQHLSQDEVMVNCWNAVEGKHLKDAVRLKLSEDIVMMWLHTLLWETCSSPSFVLSQIFGFCRMITKLFVSAQFCSGQCYIIEHWYDGDDVKRTGTQSVPGLFHNCWVEWSFLWC